MAVAVRQTYLINEAFMLVLVSENLRNFQQRQESVKVCAYSVDCLQFLPHR